MCVFACGGGGGVGGAVDRSLFLWFLEDIDILEDMWSVGEEIKEQSVFK